MATAPTQQRVGSCRNGALIEVRGGRLLPNLSERVRLHPETALIVLQFPLRNEASDRVKEVSVVNSIGLIAVVGEQLLPNVPPEGALV